MMFRGMGLGIGVDGVSVGDRVWFGWHMVRGFVEGRDWLDVEGVGRCVVVPYELLICGIRGDVEGVGRCVVVPYELLICGIRGDDFDEAVRLSGLQDEGFYSLVYGINGHCIGVPYVHRPDTGDGLIKSVAGDVVSKRVVRLLVVGGDVEYYHKDVYCSDGDVDDELEVGGWYLLDKDCDLYVEGDYAKMFKVGKVGVYRFQKRHVLARLADPTVIDEVSEYKVKDNFGVDGEFFGGVDKGDWDREVRDIQRVQRGSGKRYYF